MKFKLEADILNQTSKCNRDFSCLNGDKGCMCDVDYMINESLLYVKPPDNRACDYKISFGYSAYYCSCPTRREIYKQYNY